MQPTLQGILFILDKIAGPDFFFSKADLSASVGSSVSLMYCNKPEIKGAVSGVWHVQQSFHNLSGLLT